MLLSNYSSRKDHGFTLIELLVVIVILGILAAIAVPRFTGAQDRVRVNAARSDIDQFRQALDSYEIDYADFPAAMTLKTAGSVLEDPNENPYMTLPTGQNFAAGSFVYEYVYGSPTSYILTVTALDNQKTVLVAVPHFTGVQGRARVSAARSDIDQFREALAMFEIDYADYPAAMTLATAPTVLVDPNGNPYYKALPTGTNFAPGSFSYTYIGGNPPSYMLTALDNQGTALIGDPYGIR